VGGQLARVIGWGVLAMGLVAGILVALFASWVFPGTPAPWIAFCAFAVLASVVGLPLVFGGKRLDRSGQQAETGTRMQALFALAANRGGALRAHEAGAALGLGVDETDALLTRMAKERPDDVTLDVTDAGEVIYGFPGVVAPSGGRVRFEVPSGWSGASPGPSGARVAPPSGPVRVLDAEFEEIEGPSAPRARLRA
jgi:hypothetical protein